MTTSPGNPIKRLYNWVLHWAETPYGVPALMLLAFAESSFFPIPPDVLLIALALAMPTRAFRFALFCTLGSVLGGMFGYALGYAMWDVLSPLMLNRVFSQANFDAVTTQYQEHGFAAVFVAAFTPIPYKVFTVTAGVSHVNVTGFVLASVAGRGGRFMLVALVIRLAGDKAKMFIDRYFNLLTVAGAVVLVGGFALVKLL